MNRLFALLFALTACGGISDDTLLSEIDADDAAKLCDEFVKDFPQNTITCEFGGASVDVVVGGFENADECNTDFEPAPSDCTATVGDMRDCLDALISITEEDFCNIDVEPTFPAACDAVFACGDDA